MSKIKEKERNSDSDLFMGIEITIVYILKKKTKGWKFH